MPTEARVGDFEDEERANRTVRWLQRSGVHARMEQVGEVFAVFVPSGSEEQQAHRLLQALERTRARTGPAEPTRWEWVRSRMLNVEFVGTVVFVVVVAVLLVATGIMLWVAEGAVGWLGVIVAVVAALAFFHFSGMPHGGAKSPRPFSHKHDITMDEEMHVQYRQAWARDQWRRSRQGMFRRRRPKE